MSHLHSHLHLHVRLTKVILAKVVNNFVVILCLFFAGITHSGHWKSRALLLTVQYITTQLGLNNRWTTDWWMFWPHLARTSLAASTNGKLMFLNAKNWLPKKLSLRTSEQTNNKITCTSSFSCTVAGHFTLVSVLRIAAFIMPTLDRTVRE